METSATSSAELPGFEEVKLENLSEKTLSIEDLESRKKQLWLVKVPYDFDISTLSDTTVILNGTQDLPTKIGDKSSNRRYETRGAKYENEQSCPFKVVLPSSANENHLEVCTDKHFTGHLDITQTVKVPMLIYPPTPPPMYTDVPKGLKARWKPFGHRTPPIVHAISSEKYTKAATHFSSKKPKHKTPGKRHKEKEKEEIRREKSSPKKKKIKKEPEEDPETQTKHKKKRKVLGL